MPFQRPTASAVTRIRTWVVSATTRSTNHYTITAIAPAQHQCTLLVDTLESLGKVQSLHYDVRSVKCICYHMISFGNWLFYS